ncbi:class B sortase [Amphibacillus cookii]|uniref:class B sortase n=1 Tax=Amphibacillus cookii TaxID=767787 RepID=UPI00195DAE42|nr:class B sortase [Amphibacillus cookii]MBM7541164.1 sortase B [Amphibacillus cookii]
MKLALVKTILFSFLIISLFYIATYFIESSTNKNLYVSTQESTKNHLMDRRKEAPVQNLVGWIEVTSTTINYPVVQADDNDFYLTRNINKENSKYGSIFMDFRNKGLGQDKHTIIYGHHMKDGSMFHDLSLYSNQSFYEENTHIYTLSPEGEEMVWEVFSSYSVGADFYYLDIDFANPAQFTAFIEELVERSLISTNTRVTEDDYILTLSTCDYTFENGRYVVHSKRTS